MSWDLVSNIGDEDFLRLIFGRWLRVGTGKWWKIKKSDLKGSKVHGHTQFFTLIQDMFHAEGSELVVKVETAWGKIQVPDEGAIREVCISREQSKISLSSVRENLRSTFLLT